MVTSEDSADSDERRSKKRSSKKHQKEKRRRRDHSSEEGSYDERRRRKKDHKRKKKEADLSPSEEVSYRKRKRQKKETRKEKKKHREDRPDERNSTVFARNYMLADALYDLFENHPPLASDLPIMLIRLAGGTTFDLSQMTDEGASKRLDRVFQTLQEFGLDKNDANAWFWKRPPGSNDELVLVRVVAALLDEIGITMDAVHKHENPQTVSHEKEEAPVRTKIDEETYQVEKITQKILEQYANSKIGNELASICQMIIDGESISLENLPDAAMRQNLETLFALCGLEKTEMEADSDSEGADGGEPQFGFSLPEVNSGEPISKLITVVNICQRSHTEEKKSKIKGPLLPQQYVDTPLERQEESDDEEGPLVPGETRRDQTLPTEVIAARAAQRIRQLENIKKGLDATAGEYQGQREEWMIDPGKYDFFSAVKAGQPMRNRTFENKNANGKAETMEDEMVDPEVKAEMEAIMEAHESARGLSLMDEHQQRKAEEQKNAKVEKGSWKWNRDRDLDAGRRVDKDALNMIFGGAADDLKKKFQGGYRGGN